MEILDYATKQFDNKRLHTVLKLSASNANIKSFHLKKFKTQEIKHIKKDGENTIMYYDLFTPRDTKFIEFSYFNSLEKKIKKFKIKLKLQEELVSTQTDLNPQNSKYFFYRNIAIFIFFLISLLFYFLYKNRLFIVLSVALLLLLAFMFIPNEKIVIYKNEKIYIQPLKHSTIFKVIKTKQEAKILKRQNNFIKVMLKDDKIGWIKR